MEKNDLALVFGGGSFIGAHVITPAMILGTDDFTVEFTTKPNTTTNAAILSNTNTGNINGNYVIRALSNQLSLSYCQGGSWINHNLNGTFDDKLHDIAIVRQDTAIKFIVDNVVEYIGSIPKSHFLGNLSYPVIIGRNHNTGVNFNGILDSFKLTKQALY